MNLADKMEKVFDGGDEEDTGVVLDEEEGEETIVDEEGMDVVIDTGEEETEVVIDVGDEETELVIDVDEEGTEVVDVDEEGTKVVDGNVESTEVVADANEEDTGDDSKRSKIPPLTPPSGEMFMVCPAARVPKSTRVLLLSSGLHDFEHQQHFLTREKLGFP